MAVQSLAPKKRPSTQALAHPQRKAVSPKPPEKLHAPQIELPTDLFFPKDLVNYLQESSPNLLGSFLDKRFGERANLRRRLSDTIMDLLTCECQILLASHCAKQRSRSALKNNPTKGGTQR